MIALTQSPRLHAIHYGPDNLIGCRRDRHAGTQLSVTRRPTVGAAWQCRTAAVGPRRAYSWCVHPTGGCAAAPSRSRSAAARRGMRAAATSCQLSKPRHAADSPTVYTHWPFSYIATYTYAADIDVCKSGQDHRPLSRLHSLPLQQTERHFLWNWTRRNMPGNLGNFNIHIDFLGIGQWAQVRIDLLPAWLQIMTVFIQRLTTYYTPRRAARCTSWRQWRPCHLSPLSSSLLWIGYKFGGAAIVGIMFTSRRREVVGHSHSPTFALSDIDIGYRYTCFNNRGVFQAERREEGNSVRNEPSLCTSGAIQV